MDTLSYNFTEYLLSKLQLSTRSVTVIISHEYQLVDMKKVLMCWKCTASKANNLHLAILDARTFHFSMATTPIPTLYAYPTDLLILALESSPISLQNNESQTQPQERKGRAVPASHLEGSERSEEAPRSKAEETAVQKELLDKQAKIVRFIIHRLSRILKNMPSS